MNSIEEFRKDIEWWSYCGQLSFALTLMAVEAILECDVSECFSYIGRTVVMH